MKNNKEKKNIISQIFSKGYFKTLEILKFSFIMNIFQFIIIVVLVIALNNISMRHINTPFIVMADKNTNEIFNTLAINDNNNKSEVIEKEIERKLQDIIIITRSIPTDKEFYQKNINRVQPFFTSEAGEQLKESLRENQVTEKLNNRESVTVDIDNVIRLERNKRKYQVIWTEKYMKMTGDIVIKKYVAVIDVILVDVKSNEMKKNNPLGVMIKDINISESNISNKE